ncbi:DNA polymerase III subunit beta [Gilvimarinus agarilyticus]|uniref:DNA polymerase III subunit beta n=1 Tax=unclassified Gilvimarinus TaxID=2642066 RepID=UPI001C086ED2|nr:MULTISPECIES: DNA polymerase III subunit beta [unclassified Gilvimarinus]MBU2884216.1 DNA polymerase III subunit beta [Gilvimarinus agarilyticus]MDO6569355.1 DNA polymerase III subunit beta [Gilvimarinus sp. 2_MG-2023]MDO6747509.1 DNA polymerase III subunit beta [Gilvimarinus sp. 1_MG-2023]
MKFVVSREALIKPLQLVAGVVERRQTLPVLSNVLLVLEGNRLSLTGTDLEVEIVGRVELEAPGIDGEITVPARKFVDIVRSLPDDAVVELIEEESRILLKSGRSRFTLSTLPANDFPNVEDGPGDLQFSAQQGEIKRLIDRTAFAMAQQDVRYYLNGMLWEVQQDQLRVVATDGHRMAMCTRALGINTSELVQAILPRKGVLELARLMNDNEELVDVVLSANHIRVASHEYTFTSKLVDGKFPDYERVLPRGGDKIMYGSRSELKQAFSRTAILSNEKYRGVRLLLDSGQLTIVANNPEQEEAEEQLTVDYAGDSLEVGFNVSYLTDVANVLNSDAIKITLSDANSSALLEEPEEGDSLYVVMPMRL